MTNLIKLVVLISIVGLAGAGIYTMLLDKDVSGGLKNILTSQEAADKAINFINEKMLNGQATSSLISVTEENGLYKFHFSVEGEEYDFYISKDGKVMFTQGINIDGEEASQETADVPKSDRPDVKVFIMAYCPYGLQAQKMMLPVYDLLKDKADIEVYFVDYAMHGKTELDENLNQYCIQKEQNGKYYSYLNCFVKEGDSAGCLTEAGIDTAELATCVAQTDEQYKITSQYNDESTWLSGKYPLFGVQADLNEQYGVQGSPTIVINGVIASPSSRSPEAFKNLVCQAFNSQPSECSQTLSNDPPSAGLGVSAGSDSTSGCGS